MKTGDWLLLAGVIVGGIVLVGYVRGHPTAIAAKERQPIQKPAKPKLPRTTTPVIKPVAATTPYQNYGVCQCVGGVLTGPQCRLVGRNCTDIANRIKAQTECSCDASGTATGLNCPYIGQSCLEIVNKLKFPATNIPSYSQWLASPQHQV